MAYRLRYGQYFLWACICSVLSGSVPQFPVEDGTTDSLLDLEDAANLHESPYLRREYPTHQMLQAQVCTPTLTPDTRQSVSLTVNGVSRSALVYAPPAQALRTPLPLVLNFHGNPCSPEDQAEYTQMDELARLKGFYVVYPRGLKQAFNAGGCCAGATADDLAFAKELVRYMVAQGCIDTGKVAAAGWSNGGYMAYYLACRAPEVFGYIISVGGLIGIDPQGTFGPGRPHHRR
jgi:poly(3-hydroxybutyrate) depolymerase